VWSADGSDYLNTFCPPETIPADIRALAEEQRSHHLAAVQHAPQQMILAMLARLSVHFPDKRSVEEWTIIHEDYADALAEMPADIIAEAMRLYLLKGKFYPKLAEIMAEANRLLRERREELDWLFKLESLETPEEQAASRERERQEREARQIAETEATLQKQPHLRPFYRWWKEFRDHVNYVHWIPWLQEQAGSHSVDEIERWHQQLADERATKPWPENYNGLFRLQEIARQHGAQPTTEIPF
jgi:hypothetical protein